MFEAGVYAAWADGAKRPTLAIRPELVNDGRVVRWHDTTRYRRLVAKAMQAQDGSVVVQPQQGTLVRLEPLTCLLFDRHLRMRVDALPAFSSDEELRKFYLDRF